MFLTQTNLLIDFALVYHSIAVTGKKLPIIYLKLFVQAFKVLIEDVSTLKMETNENMETKMKFCNWLEIKIH